MGQAGRAAAGQYLEQLQLGVTHPQWGGECGRQAAGIMAPYRAVAVSDADRYGWTHVSSGQKRLCISAQHSTAIALRGRGRDSHAAMALPADVPRALSMPSRKDTGMDRNFSLPSISRFVCTVRPRSVTVSWHFDHSERYKQRENLFEQLVRGLVRNSINFMSAPLPSAQAMKSANDDAEQKPSVDS